MKFAPDGPNLRQPGRTVCSTPARSLWAARRSGGSHHPTDGDNAPDPRYAHAQFPYQTASDVVSYADHVAIVTAVSQREAPRNEQPEVGAPSDSVARLVTFRVDDVLWSRAGAPAAPKKFTALWWGWLAKGHQQFVMDGTPWVFIGGHYVVPIAYDGKEFSLIQPYAVFRFDRGTVTLEEQHTALAQSLDGASRTKAARVFATAAPDPLAVRYADLPPRDRLNAVIAARSH